MRNFVLSNFVDINEYNLVNCNHLFPILEILNSRIYESTKHLMWYWVLLINLYLSHLKQFEHTNIYARRSVSRKTRPFVATLWKCAQENRLSICPRLFGCSRSQANTIWNVHIDMQNLNAVCWCGDFMTAIKGRGSMHEIAFCFIFVSYPRVLKRWGLPKGMFRSTIIFKERKLVIFMFLLGTTVIWSF